LGKHKVLLELLQFAELDYRVALCYLPDSVGAPNRYGATAKNFWKFPGKGGKKMPPE
jgi:hypothetical protein